MPISFTQPGSAWAQIIVTALKGLNPDIKGQFEIDLLEKWTAICDGHEAFIISDEKVATLVTIPLGTAGPTPLPGTGVS